MVLKNPVIVTTNSWKYPFCPECNGKLEATYDLEELFCNSCDYTIATKQIEWE